MEVLAKRELLMRKDEILERIKSGAVFIYPTDTIYGIGCDATNERAVAKLREIKNRPAKPLSIWVPNQNWIKENCEFTQEAWDEHINQLPGPFTFILKLRDPSVIAKNVTEGIENVGVRLPDHELRPIFEEFGKPIITTSANKSGEHFMTELENLDPDIERNVDFMIYEGEKKARPSRIVNLVTDEVIDR